MKPESSFDDQRRSTTVETTSPCLRFSFSENCERGRYIACTLDEGKLRCWRKNEIPRDYYRLFFGTSEERNIVYRMLSERDEEEDCLGFDLTEEEREKIMGILDDETMRDARAFVDPLWGLSFYAELDNGEPPISIEDVIAWSSCSLPIYNELYPWIVAHFGLWEYGRSTGYSWNKKRNDKADRALVQAALHDGLDAVEGLLYDGKPSQIRLIDELPHEMPLSYSFGCGCFTLKMGRSILRACKIDWTPNCVNVFGTQYDFKCRGESR